MFSHPTRCTPAVQRPKRRSASPWRAPSQNLWRLRVSPQPRLLPVRSSVLAAGHVTQSSSSPEAGFSVTHIKGSKCAMISRAELQEPLRVAGNVSGETFPAASKALPTNLGPQKSSRSLGIFKKQDHRNATMKTCTFIGPDFFSAR